jgi:hypothetical protein
MKKGMPGQPELHFGVLVSSVVIADQVELPVRRNGLVDETEKLEPFLMAKPLLAQAKDLTVGRIQRGKKRVAVPLRSGRAIYVRSRCVLLRKFPELFSSATSARWQLQLRLPLGDAELGAVAAEDIGGVVATILKEGRCSLPKPWRSSVMKCQHKDVPK